jgi:hypothetical protein
MAGCEMALQANRCSALADGIAASVTSPAKQQRDNYVPKRYRGQQQQRQSAAELPSQDGHDLGGNQGECLRVPNDEESTDRGLIGAYELIILLNGGERRASRWLQAHRATWVNRSAYRRFWRQETRR